MSDEPFGKRMFPEPVMVGRRVFKPVSVQQDLVIIESYYDSDKWVTLTEEEATVFAFAHPAVKALVEGVRQHLKSCPFCGGDGYVEKVKFKWVQTGETPWGEPTGEARQEVDIVECEECSELLELIKPFQETIK